MLGFLRDGAYAFRLTTLVRDDLPPLCIIMAILALDYVMRKEAKKNSVLRSTTSARMQRKQPPEDEPLKSLSLAAENICHAPKIRQSIISGISANRSSLIGAVTVFSHRSIRISYNDSRNRMTAEIAKGTRRDGAKAATRPNMIPPAR
jgi:hypothetical protein